MADSPDRDELTQTSAEEAAAASAADAAVPTHETTDNPGAGTPDDDASVAGDVADEHAATAEPDSASEHDAASADQAEQADREAAADDQSADPGAGPETTEETTDASSDEFASVEPDADVDPATTEESAADVTEGDAAAMSDAEALAADGDDAEADLGRATADLKSIVEALIFASPEPLTPKALMKLLDSEPKEDVLAALDAVKTAYERPGGLQIVEVAGGFQIVTRPDLHEWVRRLFHERSTQKLSVQALETLAVIAYRQPITALEITEIRGVSASGVLNTLLERHLVKIVGRKQVVGRPFMYATTKEFLIRFGLKDISDLPKVEDMAESLGIDSPLLVEQTPPEEQLPLSEPEADDLGGSTEAAAVVDEDAPDEDSDEPTIN